MFALINIEKPLGPWQRKSSPRRTQVPLSKPLGSPRRISEPLGSPRRRTILLNEPLMTIQIHAPSPKQRGPNLGHYKGPRCIFFFISTGFPTFFFSQRTRLSKLIFSPSIFLHGSEENHPGETKENRFELLCTSASSRQVPFQQNICRGVRYPIL